MYDIWYILSYSGRLSHIYYDVRTINKQEMLANKPRHHLPPPKDGYKNILCTNNRSISTLSKTSFQQKLARGD